MTYVAEEETLYTQKKERAKWRTNLASSWFVQVPEHVSFNYIQTSILGFLNEARPHLQNNQNKQTNKKKKTISPPFSFRYGYEKSERGERVSHQECCEDSEWSQRSRACVCRRSPTLYDRKSHCRNTTSGSERRAPRGEISQIPSLPWPAILSSKFAASLWCFVFSFLEDDLFLFSCLDSSFCFNGTFALQYAFEYVSVCVAWPLW